MADGAAILRELLARPGVVRLVGAHDALGAVMAEHAGFDGVWSSSLEISASHAVPDASILGKSEHLAVARAMCQAVQAPVVADCDTGYGDGVQFAHAVREFEAAGVAGVCIEDKQFPKLNSFAPGGQELMAVDGFAEKVRAGKRAQRTRDFVLIARVEALIAGCGPDEALRRAHAYADAGADAVLMHSKSPTVDELASVVRAWDSPVPLVAVPTTYFHATADELAAVGIKVVIYANQGLRSALAAMERTYAEILRTGSTASVEHELWPIASIFAMQGMDELEPAAERASAERASIEA